jgi:hypothetical protein
MLRVIIETDPDTFTEAVDRLVAEGLVGPIVVEVLGCQQTHFFRSREALAAFEPAFRGAHADTMFRVRDGGKLRHPVKMLTPEEFEARRASGRGSLPGVVEREDGTLNHDHHILFSAYHAYFTQRRAVR